MNIITKIAISTLTIIGFLLSGLSAAQAIETQPHSEVIDFSSEASSTTSSAAHSVNGVKTTWKTQVVSYIQANGATKWQKTGHRYRLPRAMKLWTSYYNSSRQEVWHWKWYPAGKVLIKGRDGWYHDPVCWNKVKIRTSKPVPHNRKIWGKIKVVKSFTFKATARSVAKGSSWASAKAWCPGGGAEASGYGTAEFYAAAYSYGYGRTWAAAKNAARSNAGGKLIQSVGTTGAIKIRLETDARGKATSNATAKVTCGSPTPPPPPATPAPDLLEISTINDVLINNTRTIDVSGNVPPGRNATLFCTSVNGGNITAGKTQTVSGNFTKQLTYMAPSEVPKANGEISYGHDRVDCTLTQNDGQIDRISTNQFEIRPAPVDPA